jgi:hypothetical protein
VFENLDLWTRTEVRRARTSGPGREDDRRPGVAAIASSTTCCRATLSERPRVPVPLGLAARVVWNRPEAGCPAADPHVGAGRELDDGSYVVDKATQFGGLTLTGVLRARSRSGLVQNPIYRTKPGFIPAVASDRTDPSQPGRRECRWVLPLGERGGVRSISSASSCNSASTTRWPAGMCRLFPESLCSI